MTTTTTTTAAPTAGQIDEMARRLVSQDVRYCVSALVAGMLKGAFQEGALIDEDDALRLGNRAPDADDYREAATHEHCGFSITVERQGTDAGGAWYWTAGDASTDAEEGREATELQAWRAAFEALGLDAPDGSEIFEHWLVTDDLARRLEEEGESVAHDVQGLTIWGRATTGQAIYADGVFQRIAADILNA